jgi:cation:H+ antiporter
MIDFTGLPLLANVAMFVVAAAVIALVGVRMSAIADRIADATGLGEAVTGAVFLGASTSLSGIVTSVSAAAAGHPQLAFSNAVGGIAAQTFFIAVADLFYSKANLEHAAASMTNLIYGALLIAMLTLPLMAAVTPPVSVWGVHPATPLLVIAYAFGLRLALRTRTEPMWGPRRTRETKPDVPDEEAAGKESVRSLVARFVLLGATIAAAGYIIAGSGIALAAQTGLGEGLVGTLFTAVATSLPELVTTIAAVRRGALTLAVGGILGGNSFDVLFLAFSDVAYRPGSIYHAVSDPQLFVVVTTVMMTTVLLLGLLHRERHGIAGIGFESVLILALYALNALVLALVW